MMDLRDWNDKQLKMITDYISTKSNGQVTFKEENRLALEWIEQHAAFLRFQSIVPCREK
jgi:hypothetical protein